jgi:hypothetical protein
MLIMKRIILLVNLILMAISTWGQTNYYSQTKTFVENDYTYQCNATPWGFVELYNKNNVLKGKFPAYRSNGETYIESEDGFHPVMEHDAYKWAKGENIVYDAFTEQQKSACKGRRLYITCYINSETGKIDEVLFEFFKTSGYVGIPVSVFRQIELKLKREIQYGITELGRKLDFIYFCFDIDF